MKTHIKNSQKNNLTESIVPIRIMKTLVNLRKPFKEYGKVLPPEHISLNNKEPGTSHLFSYEDLLKNDSRTKRSPLKESTFYYNQSINEGLLDIFRKKSVFGSTNKPLVIETTPYKKKLHATIEAKKDKIKHDIAVIDLHKKYIDKVKLDSQEDSEKTKDKPEFKSSRIIPRDRNNPYEKYLNRV